MRSIAGIRVTLAVTMVAGLGLLLGGCGGGDETTTVTSTVTVQSQSGVTDVEGYSGTTSQGLPVSFAATHKAVLTVSFGWTARCEDGQVHTNTIRLGGAPIQNGSFVIDALLETGGVAHFEGTVEGSKASGHLSRSKGSAFGTNCLAAGISWKAHTGS
jgi:hypothetical protein